MHFCKFLGYPNPEINEDMTRSITSYKEIASSIISIISEGNQESCVLEGVEKCIFEASKDNSFLVGDGKLAQTLTGKFRPLTMLAKIKYYWNKTKRLCIYQKTWEACIWGDLNTVKTLKEKGFFLQAKVVNQESEYCPS
jgi:hypothetical protein